MIHQRAHTIRTQPRVLAAVTFSSLVTFDFDIRTRAAFFSGAVFAGASCVVRQFYAGGKISACCLVWEKRLGPTVFGLINYFVGATCIAIQVIGGSSPLRWDTRGQSGKL